MNGQSLAEMRAAIIVAEDFEQSEMTEPRSALEDAGAEAVLISNKAGEVRALRHDKIADVFTVDVTLDDADPEDFDAAMLPGGALNTDFLRMDDRARKFIRRIDETDKPIAVICHGPWLLVSAGLTSGRSLTSYHTIQDDIRNAGGRWLDLEVVRDRNWVSSRGPKDLPAFNKAMISLFSECRKRTRGISK